MILVIIVIIFVVVAGNGGNIGVSIGGSHHRMIGVTVKALVSYISPLPGTAGCICPSAVVKIGWQGSVHCVCV